MAINLYPTGFNPTEWTVIRNQTGFSYVSSECVWAGCSLLAPGPREESSRSDRRALAAQLRHSLTGLCLPSLTSSKTGRDSIRPTHLEREPPL